MYYDYMYLVSTLQRPLFSAALFSIFCFLVLCLFHFYYSLNKYNLQIYIIQYRRFTYSKLHTFIYQVNKHIHLERLLFTLLDKRCSRSLGSNIDCGRVPEEGRVPDDGRVPDLGVPVRPLSSPRSGLYPLGSVVGGLCWCWACFLSIEISFVRVCTYYKCIISYVEYHLTWTMCRFIHQLLFVTTNLKWLA